MTSRSTFKCVFAGAIAAAAVSSPPSNADACGGFFCSQALPVNQAAEQIIFADNGDGTVTAVIQIMYEGPSESFSWLLPISSVPAGERLELSSDLAFQRLQGATNPQYNLTTRVEGTCKTQDFPVSAPSGTGGTSAVGGGSSSAGSGGAGSGVSVLASGAVGAFEWTVIALDPGLGDPADAAVTWLEERGYDVSPGAPALIRPYLEDGLYLLALRLTKGADSGSIRPIVLTYEAEQPMIPIKLTAVAANDDMGVMTFLLSEARGVPQNYLALELNEARINWFNPALNYNDVVTAAADDAGGQGFVTEYAGETGPLANAVWSTFDEQTWTGFTGSVFSSFDELFQTAYFQWGSWDGFWDAVRVSVMIPEDIAFADFQLCPVCYQGRIELSPSAFVAALAENVIDPMRDTQALLDRFPYMTRLYSTLSAAEMTVDPLFTFNADLEVVSNVHTAERVIECNPSVFQFEAPWRIELPQGGVIRGSASQFGTWPDAVQEQPANRRILRVSNSGEGNVLEDNSSAIERMLEEYNESLGLPPSSSGGSSSGGSSSGSNPPPRGTPPETNPPGPSSEENLSSSGGGCSIESAHGPGRSAAWALAGLLALAGVARRRRR